MTDQNAVPAQGSETYQSLSMLSQEWLAKARECDDAAKQDDISDEEALLYEESARHYRECEERLRPFVAAGAVVIEPQKPYSNINKCPCCERMFKDGETCTRGGCPMGGDF